MTANQALLPATKQAVLRAAQLTPAQEYVLCEEQIRESVREMLRDFGPTVIPDCIVIGREQQYSIYLQTLTRMPFGTVLPFSEFLETLIRGEVGWPTEAGMAVLVPTAAKDMCEVVFKRIKERSNEVGSSREVDSGA